MPQQRHPPDEELSAFISGRLDDDAVALVEEHLVACIECRGKLKAMPPDRLTSLLRSSPHGRDVVAEGPAIGGLPDALVRHPRYRVLGQLGSGGMGIVYKAEHRLMKRLVAIKVISPRLTANAAAVARFRREMEAVAKLSHANVAAAYDADETEGQLVLVEEYVEGEDLTQVVRERGPLPSRVACDYARQAALALQHAHQRGIVHRDLKPSNLIVAQEGQVKVLDFGLALLKEGAEERHQAAVQECSPAVGRALTDFGLGMGTADFMSPEQRRDAHTADARSDVYSLGLTLLFLLTGQVRGEGKTASVSLNDATGGLVEVLERMMATDPEDRYQSMADVAAALAPFAGQTKTRPMRWRLVLAALAVLAGLLIGGWAYSLFRSTSSKQGPDGADRSGTKTGCILFARPTDSILVAGEDFVTSEATYEARVLFTKEYGKRGSVFNVWAAGAVDHYLWAGPGQIDGGVYPLTTVGAKVPLPVGVWHHVAWVYDGKEQRLYLNGKLVNRMSKAGTPGRGNSVGFVGAVWRPPEMPRKGFVGYLDTLRVSKVARYFGETWGPPAGKLKADADTLLLYDFTELAGSRSVEDKSGKGRRGLLGVGFSGATSPEFVTDPAGKE